MSCPRVELHLKQTWVLFHKQAEERMRVCSNEEGKGRQIYYVSNFFSLFFLSPFETWHILVLIKGIQPPISQAHKETSTCSQSQGLLVRMAWDYNIITVLEIWEKEGKTEREVEAGEKRTCDWGEEYFWAHSTPTGPVWESNSQWLERKKDVSRAFLQELWLALGPALRHVYGKCFARPGSFWTILNAVTETACKASLLAFSKP